MTHPNCDKLVTDALENAIWYVERYGDSRKDAHYVEQFREALAAHQSAPSTPTDEKRAALDALKEISRQVEFKSEHLDECFEIIRSALTTPPDNVGDEVVEAATELMKYNPPNRWSYGAHSAWAKLKALIKKSGGG